MGRSAMTILQDKVRVAYVDGSWSITIRDADGERVDISDEVTALTITGSAGRPPRVTLMVHSPELLIEAPEATITEAPSAG